MSKRAKSVGKQIEETPPPFRFNEWLAQCDVRLGPNEIFMLLAPHVARTDAQGAMSLYSQCRDWRHALKPEIGAYMERFNRAFATAQRAQLALDDQPFPTRGRVVRILLAEGRADGLSTEERELIEGDYPDGANETVTKKYDQMTKEWRANTRCILDFKNMATPFAKEHAALLLKVSFMNMGDNGGDPRQERRAAGQRSVYNVGTATVHFYAATGNRSCEVCGPIGAKCTNRGGFCMAFNLVPFACGVSEGAFRMLRCNQLCIERQCVRWNAVGQEPLAVPTVVRQRRDLGGLYSVAHMENNKLFAGALRHAGVPAPQTAIVIDQYISRKPQAVQDAFALITDKSPISGFDINERFRRELWARPHPALSSIVTLQDIFQLPDFLFDLSARNERAIAKRDAQIAEATREANRDKLRRDFVDLIERDSDLCAAGMQTIKSLETACPGVAATVECMLKAWENGTADHILDIRFTDQLMQTLRAVCVRLRRHDQSAMGLDVASSRAYAWISGLSAGDMPNPLLADIFSRLLLYDKADIPLMRAYVTAMHVFDELAWDQISVKRTDARLGGPGGSADPLPLGKDKCELVWDITLGAGDYTLSLQHGVSLPPMRETWLEIRKRAQAHLDACSLDATLPPLPSQKQIDSLDDAALEWLTAMAQIMSYWPRTRAFGLDILTNNSTPAVVQAVADSQIDMTMLQALVIVSKADDKPKD